MITVLVDPGTLKVGALLALDAAELHHLDVRRVQSGERIRLMDGEGSVGYGTVSLARKEGRAEVTEASRLDPPPRVVLAVGAGDKDRFAWLVEKCVELGVSELAPLVTERTGNVATRVRPEHVEKLQRRAFEAVKQSGNPFATAVTAPVPLEDFIHDLGVDVRLVAEHGGAPAGPIDRRATVGCVIGPEGGWTEAERSLLTRSGFRALGLGDHTLRFETAALAAAVSVWRSRS
jgi:16S rRNA (uracil1498-N3)-methyltransferase